MEGVEGDHLEGSRRQETAELATEFEDLRRNYEDHQATGSITAAKKRGERIINAEPVEVKCCNGKMVTPCGSFVYLGSLTTNKGESGM